MTQVAQNTLQEPSASKVGGSWHISDRWTAADIDAAARIANSSLQSTHILARAVRRLSILSGIVLYSIVVAVLAFLLSSAATAFMPADWFESVDPYVRVTAFVLAFVALNVVFNLGFGYRKKKHEVYALHQVVDDDGIRSSIPGFNCEFHWENTSKIVEDGAYILLFHEGGRYYLAVPSRGFSKQDRHEFLTYCRDHIASARPQS